MKHNTHIYLAHKSIEFLYDSLGDLRQINGKKVNARKKQKIRREAKSLQRIFISHLDRISEASWAPDDIICDKSIFHIFKLFTEDEFSDFNDYAKKTYKLNNKNYYLASGSGGLPYKIDHLSRIISDMLKLRKYNDSFSMQQIMYQFFLLSHYIIDAHVPMHCDIRDDNPGKNKPKNGKYYKDRWHGKLEQIWEKACTPIGISEGIITRERSKDSLDKTSYSPLVTFDIDKDVKDIKTYCLEPRDLMDYTIRLCINSKERNLRLFPISDPNDMQEKELKKLTRKIFADSIGNLVSIWVCIWCQNQ